MAYSLRLSLLHVLGCVALLSNILAFKAPVLIPKQPYTPEKNDHALSVASSNLVTYYSENNKGSLSRISFVSGTKQVVQGNLYDFKLRATLSDNSAELCHVVVWFHCWLRSPMKILIPDDITCEPAA